MRTKLQRWSESFPGQRTPINIDEWHHCWVERREITVPKGKHGKCLLISRISRVRFIDDLPLDFVVLAQNFRCAPFEFGIYVDNNPPEPGVYPFPILWMTEGGMQPHQGKWVPGKKLLA